MTIDPQGHFAYLVTGGSPGAVSVYSIGATGAITAASAPSTMLYYPRSLTIDPSGQFAYVVAGSSDNLQSGIFAYRIDATSGALSAVTGSPFAVSTLPNVTSGITLTQ